MDGEAGRRARAAPRTVVLGLVTAPRLAGELAGRLERELAKQLAQRFPDVEWHVEVAEEPLAGASAPPDVDLAAVTRKRMLSAAWDLAICLTDQPLLARRRPVTAHLSTSQGIALVSVPALGALGLEARVEEAVLRVIDRLVEARYGEADRRRLEHLGAPLGHAQRDEDAVRFVSDAVGGNVRLLLGMVRANRPWRLIAGLSRALVAALGAGAFGMVSTGVWTVADGLGTPRLLSLCVAAVAVTSVTLIVAHDLWERVPSPAVRDRVLLANLTTALTIVTGVFSLFVALLVISSVCVSGLLTGPVLADAVGHDVGAPEHVKVALLLSMLATLGGALGSALESDEVVRQAAYCYSSDE
jgi:hypothetical protein